MKTLVSVIVPTKNEERNIENCLRHLLWADEIIVFDSFSSDRTVRLAESLGAKVVQREFDNFAAHKNWAFDNIKTRHEWILLIDADEQVTPALAKEISQCIATTSPEYCGYYIARKNHFAGKWMRHGGWYPNWNMRLILRGKGRYEQRLVHEHILLDGPTGFLKHALIHDDYKGIERYFDRHNHYSTLEAVEAYREMIGGTGNNKLRGALTKSGPHRRRMLKNFAYRYLPGRALLKFIWMYLVRLGFLDGRIGFRYCLLHAFYEYQISLKLIELKDKNSPLYARFADYIGDIQRPRS